jgi:hypothetical protein
MENEVERVRKIEALEVLDQVVLGADALQLGDALRQPQVVLDDVGESHLRAVQREMDAVGAEAAADVEALLSLHGGCVAVAIPLLLGQVVVLTPQAQQLVVAYFEQVAGEFAIFAQRDLTPFVT